MISSSFLSGAILALGLSSLVLADANDIAACRWYVTAKTGDTCNSLAKEWGITYAIFIHNNPTVTSCYLTAGKTYCVDDRDALLTTTTAVATSSSKPTTTTTIVPTISTTSTRSSTAATPTPSVSGFTQDGRCGPQGGFQTCIGSEDGDCCSPNGWCGGTEEHCGAGCFLGYGLCSVGSSSASSTLASTTSTSVPSSSSLTSTTTAPSPTSTLIRTVQTTITVQVTAISSITNTVTSVISQTTNITLTQLALATSTSVVISTFNSLVFQTTTTTITVSRTSACPAVTCSCPFVSCPTIPSTPATTPSSSTAASTPSTTSFPQPSTPTAPATSTGTEPSATTTPSATQSGATSSCRQWYQVRDGDTCAGIVALFDYKFGLADFYKWNPTTGEECTQLWLGYYVCVGVSQQP